MGRHGSGTPRATRWKALLSPPRPGPIVVAAGGGAVLRPGNRDLMRREAIVVWLRARTSELTQRIGDVASRPLLTGPKDVADPAISKIGSRAF